MIFRNGKTIKEKEKILKSSIFGKGYLGVVLSKNGQSKSCLVHRLVAIAFKANPNQYPVINHIDGNKTNNNVNNLEWCTYKHNTIESYKNGLQKAPIGKESSSSKKVLQYDLQENFIKEWDCTMDIERDLGIANQHISACCLKKRKTSNGYIWRYKND